MLTDMYGMGMLPLTKERALELMGYRPPAL